MIIKGGRYEPDYEGDYHLVESVELESDSGPDAGSYQALSSCVLAGTGT
jgi:hypothetical protein